MSLLVRIITATDESLRNQAVEHVCRRMTTAELLEEAGALERFRTQSTNLYERVRALFFLYAIHRFYLVPSGRASGSSQIPYRGYALLLERRFEEAIALFLASYTAHGQSEAISSALAAAYRSLAFATLADQVRSSVQSVPGNQWMFRIGHAEDLPLRLRPELLSRSNPDQPYPVLHESTPVRMDLSHSGWSDIFFLGMDYPEGARVLNVSIDLAVRDSKGAVPKPPVEAFLRVIDKPCLRLVSTDLDASTELETVDEVFDFARDYLGLLKAAVVAAGIVPPAMEGSGQSMADVFAVLLGRRGLGLELVSKVNNIPKGSRLAVSTNLLAGLVSVCMRATRQIASLTGQPEEHERRLVAARAILGEWLGGSGGGWQDSGGLWPGIKLIEGVRCGEDDVEYGISRGRLLPQHTILDSSRVSKSTRDLMQASMVLVHGGMAQDVGPILEMVTERYLLRSEREWRARQEALDLFSGILDRLGAGKIDELARHTNQNFDGPLQSIIPWASNAYTESIIRRARAEFGSQFRGFWMLGGMSGGGMGFFFHPEAKPRAQERLLLVMRDVKSEMQHGVPFAMEPVVYEFKINEKGTISELLTGTVAAMPHEYYVMMAPKLLRKEPRTLSACERLDVLNLAQAETGRGGAPVLVQAVIDRLLPQAPATSERSGTSLPDLLETYGFDAVLHERIQTELRAGRIGLAQNRLSTSVSIEDAAPSDVADAVSGGLRDLRELGSKALREGAVAAVILAGGAGTRWTKGAGTVKALNPFWKVQGAHRNFIDIHLAKNRNVAEEFGVEPFVVITTSYLTHDPISRYVEQMTGEGERLRVSPGKTVGLRLIPTVRDLRFAWEILPQQRLDAQAQKVRESMRAALLEWARREGEAESYVDNEPLQCLHPVGHWYEIPNMLRSGVLASLLDTRPSLRYLMVHNVDTLGVSLSPEILGYHISTGATLTAEVMTRRIDDHGGGLARVNGQLRLIEGLSLPTEEAELDLSYYNSNTFWIEIDGLLRAFGLSRDDLRSQDKVIGAIRQVGGRMPTYMTLKDVVKRWGKAQADVFPVMQFEKLWVDMTALPDLACRYVAVPRMRGQQLKDPSQMDGWLRDGTAAYVESHCRF